jgi:hypothetical protein
MQTIGKRPELFSTMPVEPPNEAIGFPGSGNVGVHLRRLPKRRMPRRRWWGISRHRNDLRPLPFASRCRGTGI